MRNIIAIIMAVFVLVFISCEKDTSTEEISTITNYVNIDLEGDELMTVPLGAGYDEPGFTAVEGDEDVTSTVEIDGSVNDEVGLYNLEYSAVNEDGFPSSVERTVIVYDPDAPDVDLTGEYAGERIGGGGGTVTITKLAPGFFEASDFFGGYYEFIAGYGSAYRLHTFFQLFEDNTYQSLSNSSPWGPWEVLDGKYDPENQVLTHTVMQGTFGFDVVLTKK